VLLDCEFAPKVGTAGVFVALGVVTVGVTGFIVAGVLALMLVLLKTPELRGCGFTRLANADAREGIVGMVLL
jgi:hypothetical protein